MARLFFVNDTSSGLNWGSQATSAALREMIYDSNHTIGDERYKVQLRQSEPNPYLNMLDYGPAVIKNVSDSLRKLNPAKLYWSLRDVDDVIPDKYSQFEAYAESAINNGVYQSEIEAIRSSDAVVINAEGLLYQSSDRCTRSLFFIAYLATEYLDTNCVLTNVTFDPEDGDVLEMAENIFPKADQVVFREPVSAKRYGDLCSSYESAADPVFYYSYDPDRDDLVDSLERGKIDLRPYSSTTFDPTEPYITVAGNSIYSDRSQYPIEGYKHLCKELKDVCNQILLVVSASSDEQLLAPVAQSLDLDIVGLNISIKDSLNLLSHASAYVGGRYHPTIFSLKGSVPVVPLSPNTCKIKGLLELFDLQKKIFDPFDVLGEAGMISDLVASYMNSDSEFKYTDKKHDELSGYAYQNIQCVSEL